MIERSGRPVNPATMVSVGQASAQTAREELGRFATKVDTGATLNRLELPHATIEKLRDLCRAASPRDTAHGVDKLAAPKATIAVFAGPSGTGKTLAAEAVAHELSLDLYRVDLDRVTSQYIGETEKNLAQLFAAAEGSGAVLLFDEADALFGKRTDVKDAHDRYANIEVSYVLTRVEHSATLAILATNRRDGVDDAVMQRAAASIDFPPK